MFVILLSYLGVEMQNLKTSIINKLCEKTKNNTEIDLFETAKELGYKDVLIGEADEIIEGFLELNHNYKAIKSSPVGKLSNCTTPYLYPSIILKQLEQEELEKLNNLGKIRKTRGYTQSKLAELSGVNIRLIQKYESGERDFKKAQVLTAMKIAGALQVSVDELFKNYNKQI